jgi:WhiB family transcriptional regulator, redox-sensing transcriptional regulator
MTTRAATDSWWDTAACRSADPEVFFPVSATGHGLAEIARAKAICASCPVCRQCLDFALATRQSHGVWGCTSEEERRAIVASQQRGARQAS